MRGSTGRGIALAAGLAVLLGASGARAEPIDPNALLARAFSNLYADDYVQVMVLTTTMASSRPLSRTLQITRRQSERPGKALVRFLDPGDVRRTSVLILEQEDAADDLYVYLPALKLTRRVSAAQRADSFFGTDLSYEDIEPKRASDWSARIVPEDASDPACVRLEILARDGFDSTYDAMISCIEPERALIHWTDFRRAGRSVKRLETDLGDVRQVGERFIPFRMTMSTPRGGETEVRTERYDLVADVPERLFSTWNLEAGDAERDRSRTGETLASEE